MLFPNPASDKLTIEVANLSQVTIFSILGQMVYDQKVNEEKACIDVTQFQAGTYIAKIYVGGNMSFTRRFTVVK